MGIVITVISWLLTRTSNKGLDRLGRALTYIFFDIFAIRRQLMLTNITSAFGDSLSAEEKTKLARDSFYHTLLTFLEFLGSQDGRLPDAVIHLENRSLLEQALAQNQGVYALCMHLGNWEAMSSYISRHIRRSNAVVKKIGSPALNAVITKLRANNGFLPIPRINKGDGYKGMVAALDRGEIAGFVADQSRPGEPLFPFFGKPAHTNTSLAAIWLKRPAPMIPMYCRRLAPRRLELVFLPPLSLQASGDTQEDIRRFTQLFNDTIEGCIRQRPEEYFWLHNRWK